MIYSPLEAKPSRVFPSFSKYEWKVQLIRPTQGNLIFRNEGINKLIQNPKDYLRFGNMNLDCEFSYGSFWDKTFEGKCSYKGLYFSVGPVLCPRDQDLKQNSQWSQRFSAGDGTLLGGLMISCEDASSYLPGPVVINP